MVTEMDTRKTTFALAAKPYIERARLPAKDVLPVIPPGAAIWSGSGVDPSQCGKIPGRFFPERSEWSGLGGTWAVEGIPPGLQKRAGSWPTGNVGLRAASWPAIDIDVSSERARALVEEIAITHLGPAPVRERDGSPRALLVYRAAGDEPVRKMRLTFELDGEQHAVDVLGLGQQYLVAGVHPSGKSYRWKEGYDLATWGVDGIGPVTADDVRGMMKALVDAIVDAGGRVTAQSHQRTSASGEGVRVTDLDAVVDASVVLSALNAMPNTAENFPDRQDFVSVVASAKAALGKGADAHRESIEAWATAHGWADQDYFDRVWDSLTHVRVSADLLLRKARKLGWHGDAASDFAGLDDGSEQITAAQNQQEEVEQAISDAARQLVYWPEQQVWVVTSTGELLSHSALNHHQIGLGIGPAGRTGMQSSAARLRNSGLVRDVVGVTYSPGKPALIEWLWEGRVGIWFNRWRPGPDVAQETVTDEDVSVWLDHIRWLFPDDAERENLLQWMAHLVQRPGSKIRWAPVIIGAQGLGKDAMLKPLIWALGSHNVAEISPHHLLDKWTSYYESQLVVVQEMLRMDKVEVYERIKASITGTGAGTLLVEKKFQPAYPIPNTTTFCFLTNHSDAFAIAADDRRFFVLSCAPVERRDAAYYDALHAWYEKGGNRAVTRWLRQLSIAEFRPDTAPAWTGAKQMMMEETLPLFASWMAGQVESQSGLFHGRSLISVGEVRDMMQTNFAVSPRIRDAFSPKQMALGLRSIGWSPFKQQVRLPSGEAVRVWCATSTLLKNNEEFIRAKLMKEMKVPVEFVMEAGE